MTEHVLDLQGTGYFSKGKCTGCLWTYSGHAADIQRVWNNYHQQDGTVIELPARVPLPPMSENPFVKSFEKRIIVLLTHKVDFGHEGALLVAQGLAEARGIVLGEPHARSTEFLSDVMARVASLSKRQREKIRHPARNREEMQRLLEDR